MEKTAERKQFIHTLAELPFCGSKRKKQGSSIIIIIHCNLIISRSRLGSHCLHFLCIDSHYNTNRGTKIILKWMMIIGPGEFSRNAFHQFKNLCKVMNTSLETRYDLSHGRMYIERICFSCIVATRPQTKNGIKMYDEHSLHSRGFQEKLDAFVLISVIFYSLKNRTH